MNDRKPLNPIVIRVTSRGRIAIPAPYREALGVQPGDDVVLRLEGNTLRVYSRGEALRHLQVAVARAVPTGVSLAGELFRERRRGARLQ